MVRYSDTPFVQIAFVRSEVAFLRDVEANLSLNGGDRLFP
jgi:hypothetical protein